MLRLALVLLPLAALACSTPVGVLGTAESGESGAADAGGLDGGEGAAQGVCGDGQLAATEQCDDGNDSPLDGCNNDCVANGAVLWSRSLLSSDARGERLVAHAQGVTALHRAAGDGQWRFEHRDIDGVILDEHPAPVLAGVGQFVDLQATHDGDIVYLRRLNPTIEAQGGVVSLRRMSAKGTLKWVTQLPEIEYMASVKVAGDKAYVVGGQGVDGTAGLDWWVRAFDLETGAQVYQWTRPIDGLLPFSVSANAAGELLVSGVDDTCAGMVSRFEMGDPDAVATLDSPFVGPFAIAPDGAFVHATHSWAASDFFGELEFYAPDGSLKGSVQTEFALGEDERLRQLQIDSAGNVVVVHLLRAPGAAWNAYHGYALQKYDMQGRRLWSTTVQEDGPLRDVQLSLGPNAEIYVGMALGNDDVPEYAFELRAHAP